MDQSQRLFLRDLALILGLPALIAALIVAWWRPWNTWPGPPVTFAYESREAQAREEGLHEARWHGLHLKVPDEYVLLRQDSVIEVLEEEPAAYGPGSWGSHVAFLLSTPEVRQRFEQQAANCGLAPGRCWEERVGTRRLVCQHAAGVPVPELRWTPLTICEVEDAELWLALNAPEARRAQLWEIARAVLLDDEAVAGGHRDSLGP